MKKQEKYFNVLNGNGQTIPWSIAEKAYTIYVHKYGNSQSIERINERGGFDEIELDEFYPDWRKEALELAAITACNAWENPQLNITYDLHQAMRDLRAAIPKKLREEKLINKN